MVVSLHGGISGSVCRIFRHVSFVKVRFFSFRQASLHRHVTCTAWQTAWRFAADSDSIP